ncbi:right-handed parallel beta-helix repeat-containing protein [Hippea jasoniae]|uniref:right-handed parallel beta-helix repeat-containing protein n=1 Tax=Hippea jasoniae TaxID=944479 RepID=UPI0005520696|nr:right-handed parallel beta-helix repeat-containing protein [Hippea jasoniae]
MVEIILRFKKKNATMKTEIINDKIITDDVELKNRRIEFNHCRFNSPISLINSAVTFNNCFFKNCKTTAITAENSEIYINNCIFDNNFSDELILPQLLFQNTKTSIKNSSIKNGLNFCGIEAESSEIEIIETLIENNSGYAILCESVDFFIRDSFIVNNASDSELFNNISLTASEGIIQNSTIKNTHSFTINMQLGSKVEIINCTIKNNKRGIFIDGGCSCKLENTTLTDNIDEHDFAQITINNANVLINNCRIENGFTGIYASKTATVEIKNSTVSNNSKAIQSFENSTFTIEGCNFLKNSLFFDSSKLRIYSSSVEGNINITDCNYVKLTNIRINGKINSINSAIMSENIERVYYENS